jgi:hypothetical protein
VIVFATRLLLKITVPLKILVPPNVVSVNVEDERIKLFAVPELKVPPLIVVLVRLLIVFAVFEKNGK